MILFLQGKKCSSPWDQFTYIHSYRRLCLLLGYHDGFQIWDITNPDNIHEICSIRDEESFGTVSFMHIINSPYQQDTQDKHPLLAIVLVGLVYSEVIIYSLREFG